MSKHARESSSLTISYPPPMLKSCIGESLAKRARISTKVETETKLFAENLIDTNIKQQPVSTLLFTDVLKGNDYEKIWPTTSPTMDLFNLHSNSSPLLLLNNEFLSWYPINWSLAYKHLPLISYNGVPSVNRCHYDILNYLERLMKFINTTPLPEVT